MGTLKFLSEEWGNAACDAFNGSTAFKEAAKGTHLFVQHVVKSAVNNQDVSFWWRVTDGLFERGPGMSATPTDLTIIEADYEAAAARDKGKLSFQAALEQGKLKVEGNAGKLLESSNLLQVMRGIVKNIPTVY